jgi:hypothetical protein
MRSSPSSPIRSRIRYFAAAGAVSMAVVAGAAAPAHAQDPAACQETTISLRAQADA